jgi:hypothetical protein
MTRKYIFQNNKNHMFDPHHLSVITFLGSEKNKAIVLFEVVLPVYIKYYIGSAPSRASASNIEKNAKKSEIRFLFELCTKGHLL